MPKLKQRTNVENPTPPADEMKNPMEEISSPLPAIPQVDVSVAARQAEVKWWPDIRDGICEFCGVVDNKIPSWEQYKHCKHYKGVNIFCVYCEPGTDPDELIKGKTLKVVEKVDKPGILNVFHNTVNCSTKFYKSFKA